MDATTQRLARYASSTRFGSLPAQAVHEARRRLIDSVACAAAAYAEPFCASIRTVAGRYSGEATARIWGKGERTSVEMAAFANGTMLRYLDYSDTYLGRAAGHPSDMIGALVGVGEAQGCKGSALITAIVVAYEVYCGLCDAVALQGRGVDQGTSAAVGAAAGVANLLQLDETQTGNAIALALAPNIALYNTRTGELSDWKGCAGPNGARNGVFAALLAREGVSGPTAVVEGKGGLQEVVGSFDWQVGEKAAARIAGTHLKFHPVCYHGQSAIDAVLALRDKVALEDIAAIHVQTYEASYLVMGKDKGRWAPANRETADHSLPYTIAVALREGALRSDAYADERLGDAATKRIMDKVLVESRPELTAGFPANASTRLTIRTTQGAEFTYLQDNPKGNASNPLTDAELETKFTELYAAWGDASAARRTLEVLWAVDRLDNVSALVDALCAHP